MSNPLKYSPKIENNQHQWNKVKLDRLLDLLDIFYSSHMTPSNITSPKYNIVKHKDSPGLKLSNLAKISDYAQNDDILDPVKSLALDWCHQGFSTQLMFKYIAAVEGEVVQTLMSMELSQTGGIRLLVFENTIYYQVIDIESSVNAKIKIAEIKPFQFYNLSLTHDRRLYGKSLLFVKIDDEPTKEFDLEFPKFAKNRQIDSFKVAESLNGYLHYFMYFDKPVEINLHHEFYSRYKQNGIPDIRAIEDVNEIYGINHNGLRFFLAPFCKNDIIPEVFLSCGDQGIEQSVISDGRGCFEGASFGFVECLVSGNVFTFGEDFYQNQEEFDTNLDDKSLKNDDTNTFNCSLDMIDTVDGDMSIILENDNPGKKNEFFVDNTNSNDGKKLTEEVSNNKNDQTQI